jgi:serine/threonine protein phosphatase PrpC
VAVDVTERQIFAGDVLLACSFGLYSDLPDVDMELIISDNTDLKVAARELVSAAAKNKISSETISLQLMRVTAIEKVRGGN